MKIRVHSIWCSVSFCSAFFCSFLVSERAAQAFPEMIRYHYVNCTSCHVSPNGGGLLTEYGREISVAALSTWGTEAEAKPFYNLLNDPKNLTVGAFVRGVQTYQNNSQVTTGQFWYMQADLEAAYQFNKKWSADLSLGVSPDVLNGLLPNGTSPLASRRQYVMYRPSEDTSLRVGKFVSDYGVYFQDHTISTRQGIGFDEGDETYNLEYGYQGEFWSGSVSVDLGRPDDLSLMMEKGLAATAGINLTDHDKIGWSAFAGAENSNSRQLMGPYVLLGFSKKFFFVGEADLQISQPATGESNQGLFTYEKLGYDLIQGLEVYIAGQTSAHAFKGDYQPLAQDIKYGPTTNRLYGVGPGLYWFPRPHFYLQLEVQEQFSSELPSAQTTGFLTGNLYL